MAHFLQALVFLCGAGVLAAAPFSHKIHLAQKLACVTCHAAATTSMKPSENLLPSPQICAGCHTGAAGRPARIEPRIKQPAVTLVAKFNHRQHLRLGTFLPKLMARVMKHPGIQAQNTCSACHRGLEQATAVSKSNFPQMPDCLVCHTRIEPPFSCTTCHTEDQPLKPANHTAGFLDLHSSGKANLDKSTCAVCHGKRFTCLGCH